MTNYFPFRKIYASEDIFKHTRERFRPELEAFKSYAEFLSLRKGNVKVESNKAGSYMNYLVRSIIFYEEIFKEPFPPFDSLEAHQAVEMLKNIPTFKGFNTSEKRFMSASINTFQSYVIQINALYEHSIDYQIDQQIFTPQQAKIFIAEDPLTQPKKRPNKIVVNQREMYPRNIKESLAAKEAHQWQCEIDPSHQTFTDTYNRPYVEGHHIIPMATQDFFEYTIDFAHNIACLCPTCHRQIHHATLDERLPLVEYLYEKRKHFFREFNISIKKDNLLSFYGFQNKKIN